MMLKALKTIKYTGKEIIDNKVSNKTLLNYWQWAYSELVSNTERGNLAEYLVAVACGVDDEIKISWNPYDFKLKNGIKVEVKSSAYIQSWNQKEFSKPTFSISKSFAWDYIENTYEREMKRQADIYVFALLAHKDKLTINPLDMKQWEFFILNTKVLNDKVGDNKYISLSKIIKLNAIKSDFENLLKNIQIAFDSNNKMPAANK